MHTAEEKAVISASLPSSEVSAEAGLCRHGVRMHEERTIEDTRPHTVHHEALEVLSCARQGGSAEISRGFEKRSSIDEAAVDQFRH